MSVKILIYKGHNIQYLVVVCHIQLHFSIRFLAYPNNFFIRTEEMALMNYKMSSRLQNKSR